jgi:hypothetical protein
MLHKNHKVKEKKKKKKKNPPQLFFAVKVWQRVDNPFHIANKTGGLEVQVELLKKILK